MVNKIQPRQSHVIEPLYRRLIIAFSFLALILICFILYFSLSQATISITPDFKQQQIGFAVQITNTEAATTADRLPGETATVTLSKTEKFETASTTIKDGKVSGEVTLINNSAKDQTLVATTRLLTADQKLYRIDKTVVVPAKGQIKTTAAADQPGEQFVIGESKLTIPGLIPAKQEFIYAETEGFSDKGRVIYTLTQDVVNSAKEKLKNELLSQAKEELKKQLKHPENLLTGSLTVEIIEDKNDAKINSDQKQFNVSLTVKIQGLAVDEVSLKKMAQANLKEIYPAEQTIFKIDPSSFNYNITYLDTNSENLIAQIKGEYTLQVANIQIDKDALKGMSKKEALLALNNLSGIKEASILLPFWTKYLPALADKINIQIKQ